MKKKGEEKKEKKKKVLKTEQKCWCFGQHVILENGRAILLRYSMVATTPSPPLPPSLPPSPNPQIPKSISRILEE